MGLTEALSIGSLVLPFFGGSKGTESTSSGDGLMSEIFGGALGDVGQNIILSKLTDQGTSSQRVSKYMPDIEGLLETAAMKAAGGGEKIAAVDPAMNKRLIDGLLTEMLTNPIYSQRVG